MPTILTFQKKSLPSTSYTEKQETCLAITLYHEARGEGYKGMLLVGSTVINRRRVSDKPVCEIVRRWYNGYKPRSSLDDRDSYEDALAISKGLIKGTIVPNTGATHFLNKKKLTRMPKWAYTFHKVGKYKQHTFYKEEKI
jgi:spore germination cell wall hydrolase CwlJ-like protein